MRWFFPFSDRLFQFNVTSVRFPVFKYGCTIFKSDNELAIIYGDRDVLHQDEDPFLLFFIVISLGLGIDELEMCSPSVTDFKRIIAKVFGGLNVVLIGVRPMELDFLAFVRDSVNAFFVPAKTEEIPFVVIAPEEAV